MHPRTHILALTVALAAVAAGTAGTAHADRKQHRFVGIHPVPKAHGGGICHIEAPHVHAFAAIDAKVQFRDHDGWQHFVGDPVAYGWDGPKHAYRGHHPVPVHVVVGDSHEDVQYCYLDGAHYHAWAPTAEMTAALSLELRGGAYWYVGTFPRAYTEARVTYDPIDVVYEPIVYERPVVEISVAPPQWYGHVHVDVPVVVAAPVVVVPPPPPRPRGHIHGGAAVGVHVRVPAPSLRVEIGVPSVQIGIGGGVHVRGGTSGGHKHKHKAKGKRAKFRVH